MALWLLRNNFGSLLKHQYTHLSNSCKTLILQFSSSNASSNSKEATTTTTQCRNQIVIQLHDLLQKSGFKSEEGGAFVNSDQCVIQDSVNVLFGSLNFPVDGVLQMVRRCPSVLDGEFLRNWETGASEMGRRFGGSSLMIMSVLEFCRRYGKEVRDFQVCVDVLEGLGLADGTIGKVLEGFPKVLVMKEGEIRRRIDFLASIGLCLDEINRVYSRFPGLLGFGVEDRLKPLLDELSLLGVSQCQLSREIVREPIILGMELGELTLCIEFLEKLKCRVPIKEKIFREGQFRGGFAVKRRVDCLCNYGLTRRDTFSVLKREPRIITYDIADIVKKIEFLIETMKMNICCLIDVPEYLGVNFDKQIVPRYKVIEYLKSVGGLGFHVMLRDLIKPSSHKFYNLYVKPYPECQNMFSGLLEDAKAARSRHPIGLWKLMKPPKHDKSEEEYSNIRFFMESLA